MKDSPCCHLVELGALGSVRNAIELPGVLVEMHSQQRAGAQDGGLAILVPFIGGSTNKNG